MDFEEKFVHKAMTILMKRCPEFSDARDWIGPYVHHDLLSIMDLASVTVHLGIIDKNHASTAGTISILNQCQKSQNADGVAGAVL